MRAGAKIKCINTTNGSIARLTRSKVYTILEVIGQVYSPTSRKHIWFVDIEDDEHFKVPVNMSNFILVHRDTKLGRILYK